MYLYPLYVGTIVRAMSTSAPGEVGPGTSRSGSARASKTLRGPCIRSQAITAPGPEAEESPSGIEVDKDQLESRLEKMSSEICEEAKKNLEAALGLAEAP